MKFQQRFKSVLRNWLIILTLNLTLKLIPSSEADNAKFQYDELMAKDELLNKEKFMKFNFKVDRVDTFFYQLVGIKKEYQDF